METKHYSELLPTAPFQGRKVVNIKGCNGSGKSTVVHLMKETDPDHFVITCDTFGKQVIATAFPKYQWLALGSYHVKCGGCDAMDDTQQVQKVIRMLWLLDWDFLFEGAIVGDIKTTYHNLMIHLNADPRYPKREAIMMFPNTPFEECLRRIYERNGGKPIKEEMVHDKYTNNRKSREWYLQENKVRVLDLETDCPRQDILSRFLELVK